MNAQNAWFLHMILIDIADIFIIYGYLFAIQFLMLLVVLVLVNGICKYCIKITKERHKSRISNLDIKD